MIDPFENIIKKDMAKLKKAQDNLKQDLDKLSKTLKPEARFGIKVRSLREKQGISQSELATRAGLHMTYIGQVERGERNLTLDSITKIAHALNVPVWTLFYGE